MDRCDNCYRLGMELAEAKLRIAVLEATLRKESDRQIQKDASETRKN